MAAFLQTIAGPVTGLVAMSPSSVLPQVASVSSSAAANLLSVTPTATFNSTVTRAVYMVTTVFVSDEAAHHVTDWSSASVLAVRGPDLPAFGGLSLVVSLFLAFQLTGSALLIRARMMMQNLDLGFQAKFTPLFSTTAPWADLLVDVKTIYDICRVAVMDEWQDFIDNIPKNDSSILEEEVDSQILAQIRAATDAYITIRTAETHAPRKELQDLQKALEKAEDIKNRAVKLYKEAEPKLDEYDKHMDLVTEYKTLSGLTRDQQKEIRKVTREHSDLKGHKEAIALKVKLTFEKKKREEQLADAVQEYHQLDKENDALHSELAQYREKDQGEDIDALAEKCSNLETENAELKAQLEHRNDQNKDLRSENNSLKIDKANLKQEIRLRRH
ncbi:hypothetical protein K431DRAFT_294455 [Polychaeton citri CBS 116435]|uniref:Uncharacterized protein n=1 Tax=Polychaeton citri CBS 116435 TaxID=1314669 RepID=A0A9P4QA39_9PEZI|nr:hypothetical protein K431DRAFT_294455 [Polychaeton citri CBS 116435]